LNTDTYPVTRGIRVEIAAVVIISLVGIISQIKLWKVIKDRREKRAVVRLEDERQRDQMEAAVGRRLEEGNNRARVQWEAVYGDQDENRRQNPDSGIGTEEPETPRKGSISVVETREIPASTGSIEMSTLGISREGTVNKRSSNAGPSGTIPTAEGSGAAESDPGMKPPAQPTTKRISSSSVVSSHPTTSKPGSKRVPIAEEPEEMTFRTGNQLAATVPPPPVVVPLPFTIPTEEALEHDSDKSSIATFADSDHGPPSQDNRISNRSILKRLSGRSGKGVSQSEAALILPYAERSRASSVAATFDDDMSSKRSSLRDATPQFEDAPELTESEQKGDKVEPVDTSVVKGEEFEKQDEDSMKAVKANVLPSMVGDTDISDFPKPPEKSPARPQFPSLTPSTNPPRVTAKDLNGEVKEKPETPADASAPQSCYAKSEKRRSRANSVVSRPESLHAQAVKQLPSQLSKVVMSYRTNEWAKHLDGADAPDVDDPEVIKTDEPATTLAEPVAPVAVEKLTQTALNALPPPAIEKKSQPQNIEPPQPVLTRSASNMSKVSLQEQRPQASAIGSNLPPRTRSQISISNGRSPPNLLQGIPGSQIPAQFTTRGLRSSSTPFLSQTLAASPIEENVEAVYPPRNVVSPTGGPTLIAQRDNKIRNKYSSTALNGPSDSSPHISLDPSYYASHNRSSPVRSPTPKDDDNLSLSHRRELVHMQRPPSAQAALPSLQATRLSSFDSHQPQRQSSAVDPQKREAMLATWRESMRQDVAKTVVPQASVEQRRADMMMERHQNKLGKQHKEVEKAYREDAIDQAMRRGDMMEAHKEAMRRMQASANKHV
jgi:hypothetical protein